jgi:hypothetical protein
LDAQDSFAKHHVGHSLHFTVGAGTADSQKFRDLFRIEQPRH